MLDSPDGDSDAVSSVPDRSAFEENKDGLGVARADVGG
jgi:hypothetical protein